MSKKEVSFVRFMNAAAPPKHTRPRLSQHTNDALTHAIIPLPPLCAAPRRAVPQENVYPKGPSVQFYKLFLDEEIRKQFAEYDALAVIEWDVIVAHDTR